MFCHQTSLSSRYSITLLAWVYPERTGGEIISYWKDSNYGVGISLENSRPVFDVYSRDQSNKYSLLGKDNLQLNQWHHIAGAYDNNTGHARLFVDGVQVANKTMTGIFELETESGLWLGYLFKGKIAEVWIFNVSLSIDEVNKVKDFNKPPSPSKYFFVPFDKAIFMLRLKKYSWAISI